MVVHVPRNWCLVATAVALLVLSGCAGSATEPGRRLISGSLQAAQSEEVTEVHVIWNDALLELNGKPHLRGFAARVYLFGPANEEPVVADGTFTFFAWVAPEDVTKAKVKPDRIWVFSPEEARHRLRKDAFGWGYSFWLPWGPADQPELRCDLRASFQAAGRPALLSDAATVLLPGPAKRLSEYRTLERLKQAGGGARQTGPTSETVATEVPAALRRPAHLSFEHDRFGAPGAPADRSPPGERLDQSQ